MSSRRRSSLQIACWAIAILFLQVQISCGFGVQRSWTSYSHSSETTRSPSPRSNRKNDNHCRFNRIINKKKHRPTTSTSAAIGGGDDDDVDEEALLEYLDQDVTMTFEEYQEQQRREQYLRACLIFQRCSNSDLTRIANAMVLESAAKGETIVTQGDSAGSSMYFLKTGRLQAVKTDGVNGATQTTILATYSEEGGVFGELALLFGQPRAASVVATEDSTIYRLDKTAFLDSVVDSPIWETAKGILLNKYQSKRLRDVLFTNKIRLDELLGLVQARLLGRFSRKRLTRTLATFSLGAAAVLVTRGASITATASRSLVYLSFGLLAYILN